MGVGAATQSSRGCTPATEPTGSARITKGHRQLVASGQLNLRQRRWNQSSLQTDIADFGPDLEFLPLAGSRRITAPRSRRPAIGAHRAAEATADLESGLDDH